jgi:diaminopimelate decarboxylase
MLFPVSYRVNASRRIEIGGCDLADLASEHGTPLYIYDEDTVRQRAAEFVSAMAGAGDVLYSAKAFSSPAFLRVVGEEGMGLDVVSAGELHLAQVAGFKGDRIYFLGNNKSAEELELAFRAGCTIVIDGAYEFELLRRTIPAGSRARVEIRVSPGVKPDTHDFISTGQLDSKFGFSIENGQARAAIEQALAHDRLELIGIHSHIGSQIFDLRGHLAAMEVMLDLVGELKRDLGYEPRNIGAGGGLGIAYTRADDPPTPRDFVEAIRGALESGTTRRGLPLPRLVVEPGRSVAGPAGVTVYTAGSIKDIPGVRRYVAVDGGMGDNIRPKLYGARYEVLKVADPEAALTETVTIAGKYCESTDILITDAVVPPISSGDLLMVPATGAYCLAMASNYNGIPRPAVVMVRDGSARVIRRRETLDDLLTAEIL